MGEATYTVEFAKSGRGKCKKCKQMIDKGEMRLSVTVETERFPMTSHFHPICYTIPTSLKKQGIDTAEAFVDDILRDESGGEILPAKRDEIIQALETKASAGAGGAGGAEGGGPDAIVAQLKQAAEAAGADDDAVEEPKAKRAKKSKTESSKKTSSSGGSTMDSSTLALFGDKAGIEAYRLYASFKNDQLKDVLRWNRQMLTGTKPYLLVKCMDGHLRGRLARCPLCGGGRLKVNETGCQTVQCSGTFDEDRQMRVPCYYSASLLEAPRLQPWYSVEPSEDENGEMDRLDAEATGTGTSETAKQETSLLEQDATKLDWNLKSKQGIRTATEELMQLLRKHAVDIPADDGQAKQRIGPILAANRDQTPVQVVQAVVKEFGLATEKKAKAEKKQEVVSSMIQNPANAAMLTAFQELADLYFKEGNRNAGASYSNVVKAIQSMKFAVTADNAMSLCKGKTKVEGIGKASAEKMLEFCQTGTIQKLEEKRADAA